MVPESQSLQELESNASLLHTESHTNEDFVFYVQINAEEMEVVLKT